jgi:hypothetical protein
MIITAEGPKGNPCWPEPWTTFSARTGLGLSGDRLQAPPMSDGVCRRLPRTQKRLTFHAVFFAASAEIRPRPLFGTNGT